MSKAISGEHRSRLYVAFLAVELAVLFGAAISTARGRAVPLAHFYVFGGVIASAGFLLFLQPRVWQFAVGLVLLLLSLLGAWLGSPEGSFILGTMLPTPVGDPLAWRALASLFVLFPVSWLLLAASVRSWRAGLLAYLLVGAAFSGAVALSGLLGSPVATQSPPFWFLLALFALLWPQEVLAMLGVFGYRFG